MSATNMSAFIFGNLGVTSNQTETRAEGMQVCGTVSANTIHGHTIVSNSAKPDFSSVPKHGEWSEHGARIPIYLSHEF